MLNIIMNWVLTLLLIFSDGHVITNEVRYPTEKDCKKYARLYTDLMAQSKLKVETSCTKQ